MKLVRILSFTFSISFTHQQTTVSEDAKESSYSNLLLVEDVISSKDSEKMGAMSFLSVPNSSGMIYKILAVDDSKVILKTTERMITQIGHQVDTAADGLEAVEKMKMVIYDLVLMDIQMPIMDGIEATIMIRAHEKANRLHLFKKIQNIVGCSADATDKTRNLAMAAGMNDFVLKPFAIDKLGIRSVYDNASKG